MALREALAGDLLGPDAAAAIERARPGGCSCAFPRSSVCTRPPAAPSARARAPASRASSRRKASPEIVTAQPGPAWRTSSSRRASALCTSATVPAAPPRAPRPSSRARPRRPASSASGSHRSASRRKRGAPHVRDDGPARVRHRRACRPGRRGQRLPPRHSPRGRGPTPLRRERPCSSLGAYSSAEPPAVPGPPSWALSLRIATTEED